MSKAKIFIGIALSLLLQTHTYALSNSDQKINDLAHAFMKDNNVEGMSIAVINNNKTQIYNYGYANELTKTPTNSNTIYTIASFTKTFTATLAAIAAVENKLDLNAPFNQYIPALKNDKNLNAITTNELLGHVSSLPFNFSPKPKTYSVAEQDLANFKPPYAPGSQYSYSNVGIGTVGYVLQNIYGKDYQTILNANLLTPLKMTSTYLNVPVAKEKDIALGHDQNGLRPYSNDIDVWFAAASLKSTITDLAKYMNAQVNPSILNDKNLVRALAMVHENKYCFVNKVSCEQLAWQAHVMSELNTSHDDTFFIKFDKDGNPTFNKEPIIENKDFPKRKIFIDKTGSGYGMSSYMVYIPDKKQGVVILLNTTVGDERIKLGRDILIALSSN